MASWTPAIFKDNITTDPKFRPCNSSTDSDEKVVDDDVTIVVSVTSIFGNKTVHKLDIRNLQKATNEYYHLF